jgi:hypothetical protein
MALSVFDNKEKQPTTADIRRELGRSAAVWQELTEWLAERFDPLTEEWNFPGQKWGWSLRLKYKKRAVLYLTPREKYFHVGFVLGEKAVNAALKMNLPTSVVKEVKIAPKYAEGRGIRLDVRYKKDLAAVKILAEAKMAN